MTDKWHEAQAAVPWHVLRDEPTNPPPRVIEGRKVTPTPRLPERAAWLRAAAAVLPAVVLGLAIWRGLALVQAPPDAVPAPAAVAPSPVIIERVVEVTAPPVIVVVTATPANSGQGSVGSGQPQPPAAPVRVEPVQPARVAPRPAVPQAQPQPTPRPRIQPTAPPPTTGGPVRAAGVPSQPAPASVDIHATLQARPCPYPGGDKIQGTIIRGYYTDKDGIKRDAVCRADGWKAVD